MPNILHLSIGFTRWEAICSLLCNCTKHGEEDGSKDRTKSSVFQTCWSTKLLAPRRLLRHNAFLTDRISAATICPTRHVAALCNSGAENPRRNWCSRPEPDSGSQETELLGIRFGMRRSNKNGNDAPTICLLYCSCQQHGFFLVRAAFPTRCSTRRCSRPGHLGTRSGGSDVGWDRFLVDGCQQQPGCD